MKSLLNMFFPKPATNVTNSLYEAAVNQEHPKVAELREKAKAKMEQWGRKSLLEGGKFSMNNTVLKKPKTAKKPKMTRKKV